VGNYEELVCGRPLGMNFDTQGDNLIVADSNDGIFEVNLKSGQKKRLISPDYFIGTLVSFIDFYKIYMTNYKIF
jgi:hypothetical protein